MESLESRHLLSADLLYIGDSGNDSVQVFNATTGEHLGAFADSGTYGLRGPRGMVIQGNELLVVNQNVNTELNGEVLSFDLQAPSKFSKFVDSSRSDAPFAPYGIVVKDNVAYVADTMDDGISSSGRIARYDVATGEFLGNLVPNGFEGEFRPRGLVFGPDGGLYVSASSKELAGSSDPPGYVLRFEIESGDYQVVAWNNGNDLEESVNGEAVGLHNPEGIVFGTDGMIYVTANRVDVATSIDDNTHLLVLDANTGEQIKEINLNPIPSTKNVTRIFAESILFGPEGKLFIPIAQATLSNEGFFSTWSVSGGVLKYDLLSGSLTTFVTPSLYDEFLVFPSYATFGLTDPATLAYSPVVSFDVPQSHVGELPQYSSKSFDVRWNVEPGQIGLYTFDIFVSTNGGAYVKWLEDTPTRTGRFHGQDGFTYDFVSVAQDAGGHVEPFSKTADATTIARKFPWQSPVNRFDVEGLGRTTRASGALRIINYLAFAGPDSVLPEPTVSRQPGHGFGFYDVDGNGKASALDALQVINELTRLSNSHQIVRQQVPGSDAIAVESPSATLQASIAFAPPVATISMPVDLPDDDAVEGDETIVLVQAKRPVVWAPELVDAGFREENGSGIDEDGDGGSETEPIWLESLLVSLGHLQK